MRRFFQAEHLEPRVLLAGDLAYWHNASDPADVDQDGVTSPRDVLLIINQLIDEGPRALSAPANLGSGEGEPGGEYLIDVNGDNYVAPDDALLVINELMAEGENELAVISLTVHDLDPARNVITQVNAGDRFVVRSSVQDLRANPPSEGVFSGFHDVIYNNNQIDVVADQSLTSPEFLAEAGQNRITLLPNFGFNLEVLDPFFFGFTGSLNTNLAQAGCNADPGMGFNACIDELGAAHFELQGIGLDPVPLIDVAFEAKSITAEDDEFTFAEDPIGGVQLDVLGNDSLIGSAAGEVVTIQSDFAELNPESKFQLLGRDDALLEDEILFVDAQVTVFNSGTLGILALPGDLNPANGTAVINNNGTTGNPSDDFIDYTPDPDFFGTDTFTYTATDNNGINLRQTVSLEITAVNDAPIANPDVFIGEEGVQQDLDLSDTLAEILGNDSPGPANESGQSFTLILFNGDLTGDGTTTGSANGTITIDSGNDLLTYVPAPGFSGTETFTYTIEDDGQTNGVDDFKTAVGVINIVLSGVNDPPTAGDDVRGTLEDTPAVFSAVGLLQNDSPGPGDESSQNLTIIGADSTSAEGGTISVAPNGDITYNPPADFFGQDTFTYTIEDDGLSGQVPDPKTDTATITVNVTPDNDQPFANDDTFDADEDTPQVFVLSDLTDQILSNDFPGPPNPPTPFPFDEGDQDLEIVQINGISVETNTLFTGSLGGTFEIDINNDELTYSPAPHRFGIETFTYTISDGDLTDTATITIDIAGENDAPVAGDDTAGAAEDTPLSILFSDVLSNDRAGPPNPPTPAPFDESGQQLTITLPSNMTFQGGTVTLNGGSFEYTPPTDYNNLINGPDTFTYRITDNGTTGGESAPLTDTATVTITIAEENDEPIGSNKSFQVFEASENNELGVSIGDLPGPLTATDEQGQTLTVVAVTQGTLGTVNLNAGVVTYTPNAGVVMGTDTFTYTIEDDGTTGGQSDPQTDTATITVEIIPLERPSAINDPDMVEEDSSNKPIDVLANDFPTAGFDLVLVSVDNVSPGASAVINDNGTPGIPGDDFIDYSPAPNFEGIDTFTYTIDDTAAPNNDGPDTATVTITVTEVNDPIVTLPDSAETDEDVQLDIPTADLLTNDSAGPVEESGQTLTIFGVSAASVQGGTVTLNGNTITYTPPADYNGPDSFTYDVTDNGTTNGQADPDTATETVSITVFSVNDDPEPVDDNVETVEDTPLTFEADTLADNDAPGPATATDETGQNLTVTGVSATSAAGGMVTFDGTDITYTPPADHNGTDTFTYTVEDDGLSDGNPDPQDAIGTVTVTISEVNDEPIAVDDSRTTPEDISLVLIPGPGVNLLSNDLAGPANESGQTLAIISVQMVSDQGGTVSLAPNGTVTYTPPLDYFGSDTFTYTIEDDGTTDGVGDALTDTATVTINITEVNDRPTATPNSATTAEDTQLVISGAGLLADDLRGPANESGQTITIIGIDSASDQGGTLSLAPNGDITYFPPLDFFGTDTFTYTIEDNGTTNGNSDPLTDTATVTITVTEDNDAPIAGDDTQLLVIVQPLIINISDLLANDVAGPANESGQTLTFTPAATSAGGGTIVDNGNGTITYNPPAGFNISDTFTYIIEDDGTTNGAADPKSDTGTVTILNFLTSDVSGFVYVDTDNDGVREPGESGIAGVVVTLTGFDFLGNAVTRTDTTDMNGAYSFSGLAPTMLPEGGSGPDFGGYTISASTPHYMSDGKEQGGLQGGADTSVNDQIRSVHLPFLGTSNATENNFGERGVAPQFITIAELFASSTDNGFVVGTNLAGHQFWSTLLDGMDGVHSAEMRLVGPAGNEFSQVEVRINDGTNTHVRTIDTATTDHFRIMGQDGAGGYVLRWDGTVEELLGFSLASANVEAEQAEGEAAPYEQPSELHADVEMIAAARGDAGQFADAVDAFMNRFGGAVS